MFSRGLNLLNVNVEVRDPLGPKLCDWGARRERQREYSERATRQKRDSASDPFSLR